MEKSGDRKVAIVLPNLNIGGAESQALELARRLPSVGWSPVLFLMENLGGLLPVAREMGVPMYDLKAERWHSKKSPRFWMNTTRTILRIRNWSRREGCQVVFSLLFWENVLAAPAASLAGLPCVTGRRAMGSYKDNRPYYQRIEDFTNRFVKTVVCNSLGVRDDSLRREKIAPDRVRVIYNGVDSMRFGQAVPADLTAEFGDGKGIVIGTVGNVRTVKRHDVFLRALAKARESVPELRGMVCGRDLGAMEELKKLRCELGQEAFFALPGSIEDTAPYHAAFDIFAMTSDHEGLPNAVLEAMASGKPVVATKAGGTGELVVEGETGFLLDCGDVDGLAKRFVELARSAELRKSMGAAGRARVEERFTMEALARAYGKLFDALVETGEAPPAEGGLIITA